VAQPEKPIEVFISYSHKDDDLRREMMEHLSVLQRQGIIAGWDDRLISAGEDWKGEIDKNLNSAQIILLLISSSFINSDYCCVEMQRAMERHAEGLAEVIPVILRDCEWRFGPLSRFQALPADGKPITSWKDRDVAFSNVVRGIGEAIKRLRLDVELISNRETINISPRTDLRPPPLPYLCDRDVQTEELRDALELHQKHRALRPMVCLIHGAENEAHSEFLDLLQHRKLPKLLNLDKVSIADCEWMPHPNILSKRESLWRNLGDQLIPGGASSAEEALNFISHYEQPLMICTRWKTESFERRGEKMIGDMLQFWNDWPDLPPGRVLINFVCIKYQFFGGKGLFHYFSRERKLHQLNEQLRGLMARLSEPSLQAQTYPNLSAIVLSELQAITSDVAEAWTHNDEVEKFCCIHERQIRNLYKKRGNKPMAMDDFFLEIDGLINARHRVARGKNADNGG
jgi:hypothetical protein